MPVALGSQVLTAGASSKGASRSCQRCWKVLSGQIGRANGRPVVAVYFSPRRVYTSESVRQADLGARKLRMSSQHSSGGRTSEAYLAIAPCYISRTQLGWAKRTATANWRRACGEEMAHSAMSSPTRSPSRRLTALAKWTRWVVSCATRVCDLGMMKLQQ